MRYLPLLLIGLGIGFFVANLRLFFQFVRFSRLRRSALLIWPGPQAPVLRPAARARRRPQRPHPLQAARVEDAARRRLRRDDDAGVLRLCRCRSACKIGRGFYEDGIWADAGFIPYSRIGGLTWREGEQLTLVLIYRMRAFARRLVVPEMYYGAARRLLRDKIAAHDIHFTGKTLDLGMHDERDDV